jgi:hypothetical protein
MILKGVYPRSNTCTAFFRLIWLSHYRGGDFQITFLSQSNLYIVVKTSHISAKPVAYVIEYLSLKSNY